MSVRHFDALPKPYKAYGKVILNLIKKPKFKQKTLPQAEYIVDGLRIDSKHLKSYNDICAYKNDGTVPATYLAVLAQSLQMSMMTEEKFPFALLGMVHIRKWCAKHVKLVLMRYWRCHANLASCVRMIKAWSLTLSRLHG